MISGIIYVFLNSGQNDDGLCCKKYELTIINLIQIWCIGVSLSGGLKFSIHFCKDEVLYRLAQEVAHSQMAASLFFA
jgi:hypothetical protein